MGCTGSASLSILIKGDAVMGCTGSASLSILIKGLRNSPVVRSVCRVRAVRPALIHVRSLVASSIVMEIHPMNRLLYTLAVVVAFASTGSLAQTPTEKVDRTVYSGTLWRKDANAIRGTYQIIEHKDGTRVLRLGRDFQTKPGPDLKVVLSPLPANKITLKNVLSDGLVLSELGAEKGVHEIAIPTGTDLKRYRSIAIHCEKYTKLWGAIAPTPGQGVASGTDGAK